MVNISLMISSSAAMHLRPCLCKQLGAMKLCRHICQECSRNLSHTGNMMNINTGQNCLLLQAACIKSDQRAGKTKCGKRQLKIGLDTSLYVVYKLNATCLFSSKQNPWVSLKGDFEKYLAGRDVGEQKLKSPRVTVLPVQGCCVASTVFQSGKFFPGCSGRADTLN